MSAQPAAAQLTTARDDVAEALASGVTAEEYALDLVRELGAAVQTGDVAWQASVVAQMATLANNGHLAQ